MLGIDIDCQYFFKEFWQPCNLIDLHNVTHVGMIYSIEFKGSMFNVFSNEVRFINDESKELIVPLSNKNLGADVVFH